MGDSTKAVPGSSRAAHNFRKLATCIWELDFIGMDELLPSNRAIQALEGSGSQEAGTSSSVGIAPSQNRRTTDVMAWVQCFNLYTTVTAQRRPELIGPMAAHLHTVLAIHNAGGLAWYQYDWRTRRESCATGPAEWGRHDPFNLVSCCSGGRSLDDPFGPLPFPIPIPSSRDVSTRETGAPKPRQPPQATGASRKKGGLCRLFNKAPGGAALMEKSASLFIAALSVAAWSMDRGIALKTVVTEERDTKGDRLTLIVDKFSIFFFLLCVPWYIINLVV